MSMYEYQSRDDAFNQVASVTLADGEAGEITFSPSDRTSQYFLRMLAASKKTGTTYRVDIDGVTVYDEAAIPPTDVDDAVDTFTPPETFEEDVSIRIANTSGTTHTYRVQVAGWERRRRASEPEEVPW